jgi:hypothetical protein
MNAIHGIRADTSSTEQNLPYATVFTPTISPSHHFQPTPPGSKDAQILRGGFGKNEMEGEYEVGGEETTYHGKHTSLSF